MKRLISVMPGLREFVFPAIAGIVTILGIPTSASVRVAAAQITLDFSSLPSAQGWGYDPFNNSLSESQAYSISGGVLHQDTMASGYQGQGDNCYKYTGSGLSDGPFSIEIAARVTDYAISPSYSPSNGNPSNNPFGFGFGIGGPDGEALVGITPGYICLCVPPSERPSYYMWPVVFSGDNTGFHDYLLVGSLAPGGTFSLYRDDVFVASNGLYTDEPPPTDILMFGDLTGGANAVADIGSYSYTPTPEPSTLALLGIGAISLLAYGWRQRRRAA